MNPVGDHLRKAREEQGRSLEHIATATRINKKFLEEIEQGVFSSLPQTYVRAFIRAYAAEVNLDPFEVLNRYEATLERPKSTQPAYSSRQMAPPAEENTSEAVNPSSVPPRQRNNKQSKVLLIFSILLVTGLTISLLWIRTQRAAEPTREIVFQDMMKDLETKNASSSQSLKNTADSNLAVGRTDSLFLEGTASDTVWIRFAVDKGAPHEVILKPHQHMKWGAKDKFLVSLGNAGGVSFTLNGTSLGFLGKRGKPLGNISIGRETLDRAHKSSPQ